MDPLVKVKARTQVFKAGETKPETTEKKEILINTNLVFSEGSDLSLRLLGENVKNNVWV